MRLASSFALVIATCLALQPLHAQSPTPAPARPPATAATPAPARAQSPTSSRPPADAPRTLTREADPVILTGAPLAAMLGTPLARLGCFRADGSGSLLPIPCQVDERTADGNYVLTKGPEANPEDSDGKLSAKDELVFMAKDAGPRRAATALPPGARRGVELELRDPLDGGTAYVYLLAFDRDAPRSSQDYVRYTPGTERVDGMTYALGFSKQAPIVFDTLILKKEGGGSGVDPIDRMKIRLKAKVWGTIPIDKGEEDYTSLMIGYIDGPVRVVRRSRNRLVLFWKIPSPSAVLDNYFYDSSFEFPIVVSLPFDLDTFLSEASLRISVDMEGNPNKTFYNQRNLSPVLSDGAPSDAEARLDRRPYEWSVIHGTTPPDTAGWVNRLSLSTNTRIDPWLFYQDDAKVPDPPEKTAGQVGHLGYEVQKLTGLTKGTHTLTSVMYSFPRATPGIEKRYLSIKDAPLQVRAVRPLP